MQHTIEAPKQYQCRHIFTDGHRCASPCLRGEEFCYYHHNTRTPIGNPKQRRSRRSTFHLPLPEDRSAIQAAIGQVLQRIASNDIDPRRAGLLLYGLQIASINLPKPQTQSQSRSQSQSKVKPETETVEEITIDPTLGVLAPRAELSALVKPKSVVAQLLEKILLSEKEEERAVNPGIDEVAPAPAIVPILQATEDDPDSAALSNPIPKNVNTTSKDVISTEAAHSLIVSCAVEKSAVAFAVVCPPQPHPKNKTVISTGRGRTQPPCRRSFLSRHPMNLQQAFTASTPVAAQLQNPKFSSIHTP